MDPQKFFIDIETWHLPDNGTQKNACKLNPQELKKRKVINIDIGGKLNPDYVDENSVKYTPSKHKSDKTGMCLFPNHTHTHTCAHTHIHYLSFMLHIFTYIVTYINLHIKFDSNIHIHAHNKQDGAH